MDREQASETYNAIRRQFSKRELPDANFEDCEWFTLPSGIHGRESKARVMLVQSDSVLVIDKDRPWLTARYVREAKRA